VVVCKRFSGEVSSAIWAGAGEVAAVGAVEDLAAAGVSVAAEVLVVGLVEVEVLEGVGPEEVGKRFATS